MRTSPWDGHDKIDNGVLGLMGEAGELIDVYKKYMYQSGLDAELPKKQLIEELGDVLWYLAELADGMVMDLIDIMGEDFQDIDKRQQKKAKKDRTLRGLVISIAGRAYSLNRAVNRSDYKAVGAHMRKIMLMAAYVAHIAGGTLEIAAKSNIEKLKKRYPLGFDARKSMARYE